MEDAIIDSCRSYTLLSLTKGWHCIHSTPTMTHPPASPPLLLLPSELQLAIVAHLSQPQDVLSLGTTCRALHALATSDDVWRSRVEHLVKHHMNKSHAVQHPTSFTPGPGVYGNLVDHLLGGGARYLGWWASTQPFRGRLMRVSIVAHNDDLHPPSLAIVGEEVSCINAYDTEAKIDVRPPRWKPAAAHWHNAGRISYRLPINHLSPHAGLSVDVLYPILKFTPIFSLTREEGFTLIASNGGANLPILVPLSLAFRRKLEDISGTSEHPPSRYSFENGPCFPGHDAYTAGLLRGVSSWDEDVDQKQTSDKVHLQDEMLTAPAFTLKARRAPPPTDELASSPSSSTMNGRYPTQRSNNMDYIFQSRVQEALPTPQAPILLANPGGNHLFRAFLEGIGAALPQQMHDALFDEPGVRDLQEYFYPLSRCPMPDDIVIPRPLSKPVLVKSLEGLWVGCYSTHGYEFGIINVRNAWMPIYTMDESSVIEQFYAEQRFQEGNAVPSVTREPLAPNLAGSNKVLRTIIELVKVTGDVNVPAGQVSWCAVLPRPFEDHDSISSHSSDIEMEFIQDTDLDISDIESIELPTVRRKDWEEWSDAPPHTAEEHYGLHNPPRWDEGTLEAAGRIAFTGFIDTRFIDAVATFVREENGQVDEIRITWHEMGKVSCYRRCHLD